MNFTKNSNRKNIPIFLILLAFSFGILYICTASSPRYATNPWNDANAFFTVGRAMADGLTVYKDIFEQKGPLLYLIHALASFISDSSFTGVYIFQSIALGINAFAAYKIASLYVGTGWSVTSAVFTCYITVNSTCYYYGDSAEEFCLPLLVISLYVFCAYFKDTAHNKISKPVFFIVGFFAGCAAMIKFTLIGFWFAWAAYISLYTLFAKKDFKNALLNALIFLGGMAAAIVPWIIYFAAKGALHDFIYTYFVLNATAYPNNESLSIVSRLIVPIKNIVENIIPSTVVFICGFLGAALYLFTGIFAEKKVFSRLSIPFVCALGTYIIYFGLRKYTYYFLPISVFSVFAFITMAYIAEKIFKGKENQIVSGIFCVFVAGAVLSGSFFFNETSQTALKNGEETVQYKAAQYIKSHNVNGRVLNYQALDTGIYLAAGQIPTFKHFEKQNLIYKKYRDNTDEQNRYIDDGEADYVVTSIKSTQSVDDIYGENINLKNNYRIVYSEDYTINHPNNWAKEYTKTFYLFERN